MFSDGTKTRIKVLITDDHEIFRRGVKTGLAKRRDIEFIGEAENGQDLLTQLEYLEPDVILLDISMPVMDGQAALPIIKERFPAVKVIMLTMHNDPVVIATMMSLGANSYLTCESSSENIYEAILSCYKN